MLGKENQRMIRAVVLLALLTWLLSGGTPTSSGSSESTKRDSCSFSLPADHGFSPADVCALKALQQRCSDTDRCMMRCLLERKGEGIGGGCYHNCAEFGTGAFSPNDYKEPIGFHQCYANGRSCDVSREAYEKLPTRMKCIISAIGKRCNQLDACFIRCETSPLLPSMEGGPPRCKRICLPYWSEPLFGPSDMVPPDGLAECQK